METAITQEIDISAYMDTFREQGFVHIPNVFSPDEISMLLNTTDDILANEAYKEDLLAIDDSKRVHKILYPLNKSEALLPYIVHPVILQILKRLIPDFTQTVLTWEDILIKIPHQGIPVHYHQDLALQSAKSDIFSIGIYLNDSTDNPVYYLPESFNYGALTKDELYRVVDKHKNDFIPVIAKAGDLVMHYVKTIHYSDVNASPNQRYTWYLEYRTIDQLRNDSPWDKDWIMKRRAIFAYALLKYKPKLAAEWLPDKAALLPYLDNIDFKVSHTNEKVQYDMNSPYNHFA